MYLSDHDPRPNRSHEYDEDDENDGYDEDHEDEKDDDVDDDIDVDAGSLAKRPRLDSSFPPVRSRRLTKRRIADKSHLSDCVTSNEVRAGIEKYADLDFQSRCYSWTMQ